MIPEAPFLFSMAALNASLAGLAGLVAGLRRGAEFRAIDRFRLRQIVEYAFANIVVVLLVLPLTLIFETLLAAVRAIAALVVIYEIANSLILRRRIRGTAIAMTRGWALVALGVNLSAIALAAIVVAVPTLGWFQILMIVMLVRPMAAFLLVLTSIEGP